MAGFFGLFDYNKVGPGVSKGGPQKKAFVRFFEIYMRKFWKLAVANLLYVVVSLPVATVGLANAGLAYITRNFVREKHAFVYADFTDTIKKNWKQALPIGIINTVIMALLIIDLFILNDDFIANIINAVAGKETYAYEPNTMNFIFTALILSIMTVFSFMKYYIYIMIITFKLSLKQIYKNSIIFAFAGLGRNIMIFLIMGLIYAGTTLLMLTYPEIGIAVMLLGYLFLFPAFKSFLVQFAVFPLIKKHIIDPYYKDHPGEDKEAKRALNLEDDVSEDDDEQVIFEDMGETDAEPEEEKPKTTFPRQYSKQEMDKLHSKQKRQRNDADDDGTI